MIPYRTRRALRRLCVTVLVLLLIVMALALCWLLWLNRYVIYTRDGAKLDFNLSMDYPEGEVAVAPTSEPTIPIYYNEGGSNEDQESHELAQISGLYVTGQMLSDSFDAVEAQIKTLSSETPVMLDVKNMRGEFYYSTSLGRNASGIDPEKMDSLIAYIHQTDHYLIARLPAFRDYWYGLEHVDNGIFNPNRLSLWMDSDRCYWLNPAAEGTLTYLVSIVTELRTLGFDEVVFTDFCIPDTTNIYFEGDRAETINSTAASIAKICTSDSFAVSFANSSDTFVLPEGRCRLYLENVAAADAAAAAEKTGIADPSIRVVFLTDLMDTRFDSYSVLRPLEIEE